MAVAIRRNAGIKLGVKSTAGYRRSLSHRQTALSWRSRGERKNAIASSLHERALRHCGFHGIAGLILGLLFCATAVGTILGERARFAAGQIFAKESASVRLGNNDRNEGELESLRRPPLLLHVLPEIDLHGAKFAVPEDHTKPFVFAAVGVPAIEPTTNSSHVQLFLYTQGTLSWVPEFLNYSFSLNITSCLVGVERYPVTFDSNGVYTCDVSRRLIWGERLTVIVSPTVWVNEPLDPVAKDPILRHLGNSSKLSDGAFALESGVVWQEQMDDSSAPDVGRYNICLMTQEKVFSEYLPEWIAYHRRIGIDYVYIYDNNSPANLTEQYKDRDDVEIVQWPWERSQLQAQNHFLLAGRRRCQWAVLIDVDEYLMVRQRDFAATSEQALRVFLRRMREKSDYSQIRVTSIVLGSSGHAYRPHAPLAEAYWHLAIEQDKLTKPVVWLGHAKPDSIVHHVSLFTGYYTLRTDSVLENQDVELGLCHMKYRSWEDYVYKGRGGRNSFQVQDWEAFVRSWTLHNPHRTHLQSGGHFAEFRNLWRRIMLLLPSQPPVLRPLDDAKRRENRVTRSGYAWKPRRLDNSTFGSALVEDERQFRILKPWELARIEKMKRKMAPANQTIMSREPLS